MYSSFAEQLMSVINSCVTVYDYDTQEDDWVDDKEQGNREPLSLVNKGWWERGAQLLLGRLSPLAIADTDTI